MIKEIVVRGHNPKGLDYEHLTTNIDDARIIVGRIARRGATDITLNNVPVPPELVEACR